MSDTQPTSSDGDASNSDPIDRIDAWLAAQDGDSTEQTTDDDPQGDDEGGEPKNAATPPDNPAKDAPAKDAEPQITTAQLAAFLGVDEADIDVDADGTPVFRNKIDGKESTAKFADIRKSYQQQGHAENQMREAAAIKAEAQRKVQEADQAIAARHQQFQQSLQDVHNLTAVAQAELQREFNAVPWDQLRQADPAEFAARRQEFNDRNARIQAVFQNLNQRHQQAQQAQQWQWQQQQQAQSEAEQAALASEAGRVTELIPEWKNDATAQKEVKEIREWALKEGYSADELNGMRKAHQVKAIRMAWQQATLREARPAVENKVRAAPKLVKPGQAPQTDGNTAMLKDLKQRSRATGGDGTKAAAAWLIAKGLA
jgi:hypothetical protein